VLIIALFVFIDLSYFENYDMVCLPNLCCTVLAFGSLFSMDQQKEVMPYEK